MWFFTDIVQIELRSLANKTNTAAVGRNYTFKNVFIKYNYHCWPSFSTNRGIGAATPPSTRRVSPVMNDAPEMAALLNIIMLQIS